MFGRCQELTRKYLRLAERSQLKILFDRTELHLTYYDSPGLVEVAADHSLHHLLSYAAFVLCGFCRIWLSSYSVERIRLEAARRFTGFRDCGE